MRSGITTRIDNAQAVLDSLKALANKDVLVGIPADASDREAGKFGNAGIGYINEKGSPAQNIPARPHLVPGVRSVDAQTLPHLKTAARAALDGDTAAAESSLNRAGTVAANGVKRYITTAGFVPLADSTVAARAARGRKGSKAELVSRAAGNAPDNANARPLIDTGEYRRAVTHVVRNKNADA